MKAIVANPFRCKYTNIRYLRGQAYEHGDPARIEFLTEAGYLEDAPLPVPEPEHVPEPPVETKSETAVAETNTLQLMTKKELEAELKKRGIAYNPKQTKADLIALLTK